MYTCIMIHYDYDQYEEGEDDDDDDDDDCHDDDDNDDDVIDQDGLTNDSLDWSKSGVEMSPLQWHQQLSYNNNIIPSTNTSINNSTSPTIILDCRNSYESDVGRFEGAIPLNTTFFRDSWIVLDELLKDTPKDAPILTYCTGGIRCVKVKTCHVVYEEEFIVTVW